jgi:hypothetical protein
MKNEKRKVKNEAPPFFTFRFSLFTFHLIPSWSDALHVVRFVALLAQYVKGI